MEKVMVVDREKLFAGKYFQGFYSGIVDFSKIILGNFQWMERKMAESNLKYKQPIVYAVLFNPKTQKVFLYRRSSGADCREGRLRGKWSCGVGGHISDADENAENIISAGVAREISEEVSNPIIKEIRVLGYINDDSNDIGKVHFGILYVVIIENDDLKHLDPEISRGGMIPLSKIEETCGLGAVIENWTQIALKALRVSVL